MHKALVFALLTAPLAGSSAFQYSTYFGGKADDFISRIVVDGSGYIYLAGETDSTDLPAPAGGPQRQPGGRKDAFVAKLNPTGTAMIYLMYLGGSGDDSATDLAVDAAGNAYVAGTTNSTNFPVTEGAWRATSTGGAFVTKINPSGSGLVYSTYLDSVGAEAYGIAVDTGGSAYVTGTTFSSDFPTTANALQRTAKSNDIFVAKLNPAGTGLVYSTLIGGSGNDTGLRIAVSNSRHAFVTGVTESVDFPATSGAFQRVKGIGRSEDAFVLKLNPEGSALVYATYLGGSGPEGGRDIALNEQEGAYVTGITYSQDFPVTPGAFQKGYQNNGDAFVARLNPAGSSLDYSTYLGGPQSDSASAITIGPAGQAYVVGSCSAGFPLTPDAVQASLRGSRDAFAAKLSGDGSSLQFSTYLGGSESEGATSVALDSSGKIHVVGTTMSADFPVSPDALQTSFARGVNGDAFVTKIEEGTAVPAFTSLSAASYALNASLAPESIASGFGANLASTTEAASSTALPTTLSGVSVRITDSGGAERLSPLYFVSPSQINYTVSGGMRLGVASVAVFNQERLVARGQADIAAIAPALFSKNGDGRGVAAAYLLSINAQGKQSAAMVFSCGASPGSCVPAPVELGGPNDQAILVLFGTGIRGRSALQGVKSKIGGEDAEVLYAGPQSEYPGLDQVNLKLSPALRGRGAVDITLTVDNKAANSLTMAVK